MLCIAPPSVSLTLASFPTIVGQHLRLIVQRLASHPGARLHSKPPVCRLFSNLLSLRRRGSSLARSIALSSIALSSPFSLYPFPFSLFFYLQFWSYILYLPPVCSFFLTIIFVLSFIIFNMIKL